MSTSTLPNQAKRVAGGGGPPYDDSMDRRLTILDTRFDTMIGLHISPLLAIMGNPVLMFNVIRQFAPAQASAPASAPAVAPRPNLDPIQRP